MRFNSMAKMVLHPSVLAKTGIGVPFAVGHISLLGKIGLTSVGAPFALQHACFAVRDAPWQFWPFALRGGAKNGTPAAPIDPQGSAMPKLLVQA